MLTRSTMRKVWAVMALAAACCPAGRAEASGYLLYDQSAEAMGRASAVSAGTREPAAIWYNPANLSYVPEWRVSATGMVYVVNLRFAAAGSGEETRADTTVSPAGAVFAAGPITDRLHAGLGVYSGYGLGSTWPSGWVGRTASISSELTTYSINPTLAYRLSDTFSVGAGYDLVRAAADNLTGLPVPIGGTVRVGGATWGHGANVGMLARIVPDRFHAALSWRSSVALTIDGRADFDPASPEFLRELPDQGGSAKVKFPDIVTAGFMARTAGDVRFGFDASYVRWSVYDKQVLEFERTAPATSTFNFHDVVILRAGVDGPTGVSGLRLRTGMMYEQKPSRPEYLNPSLPDAHILDFAAGAGWIGPWWKADAGYVLGLNWPTTATGGKEGPEGTYRTVSHVMTVTFTARLGASKASGW
ncbi:MAG TPA: outer membrane protein transport protein [Polyangiaceae bacterium]|nr:outer membrane protein transport protein [Polyangiaceae bacterium]